MIGTMLRHRLLDTVRGHGKGKYRFRSKIVVVAEATGRQTEYMREKELPGSRYRAMLIDYIGKFNGLTRKQINDYMIPEIRGELSIEEKIAKISNLLTYMRRLGEITNTGSATKPLWKLSDNQ